MMIQFKIIQMDQVREGIFQRNGNIINYGVFIYPILKPGSISDFFKAYALDFFPDF